jgi:hypothetical protein
MLSREAAAEAKMKSITTSLSGPPHFGVGFYAL